MTQQELHEKLERLKIGWESQVGPLTDIWIHPDFMDVLDERNPIDRIRKPYMIGDTYITTYFPVDHKQVRIAFLADVDLEEY